MRLDFHYRRDNVVDVDAAVVGVSRLRWESLTPDAAADLNRAQQIMAERQFDLMPVDADSGEIRAYVKTENWGDYSAAKLHEIASDDLLPQRTPLEEIVRAFAIHRRDFFFLTSYGRVTGLITIVNLNCRQVRVFLYGLLNELEVAFGRLVQSEINRGALTVDDVLSNVPPAVREAFERNRDRGVDSEVVEYLYLPNLIKVIRKRGFYDALGYDSGGSFEKPFNRLVKLRNKVAHPVRSLVDAPDAAEKLWRDVSLIEQALSRLGMPSQTVRASTS